MTVSELRKLLEGLDDDVEVRLAMQPTWPMEYKIGNLVQVTMCDTVDQDDLAAIKDVLADPEAAPEDKATAAGLLEEYEETKQTVVYIGEGEWLGYLPGVVSRELGW